MNKMGWNPEWEEWLALNKRMGHLNFIRKGEKDVCMQVNVAV